MSTYKTGQRILIADLVSNPNDYPNDYQTAHECTVVETTDEWIKVKCDDTTRWYKTTTLNIVAELKSNTEDNTTHLSHHTCSF